LAGARWHPGSSPASCFTLATKGLPEPAMHAQVAGRNETLDPRGNAHGMGPIFFRDGRPGTKETNE
jgi:hypothetical protein